MRLVCNDGSSRFECLGAISKVETRWLRLTDMTQNLNHLFFFEEFEDARPEVVEMWGKGSQVHGPWIGLERIQDARC